MGSEKHAKPNPPPQKKNFFFLQIERSSLESLRELSSEIAIKKSDLDEKEGRADRILSKNVTEFTHVFEGGKMPDTEDLKSKFNEKLEKFSNAKKEIEKDIERLKAEVKSKKDHRRNVLQDVTSKEVNPKYRGGSNFEHSNTKHIQNLNILKFRFRMVRSSTSSMIGTDHSKSKLWLV